jgi:hypothetical protein
MPDKAKANEEINVKLKLETELRECMVVSRGLGEWPQDESDS